MAEAVEITLAALDLKEAHRAAAELARVYAGQLDSAERAERAADRALSAAERSGADVELLELIETLRSKLAARTTIANIGPRLESLLGKLLATPKETGAGAPAEPAKGRPTGSLALIRGERG